MKKIFTKKEKTEEELKAAQEKKEKVKETAINVGKVVVGVAAFAVGALLVLCAVGVNTESSDESSSENKSPDVIPLSEDSFADHEETNPSTEETV